VITRIDERLRDEARSYAFCFTCERCAHFAPETSKCGNGYPTEPHRDIELEARHELAFCKEFELA
jgi:hypothetical protein